MMALPLEAKHEVLNSVEEMLSPGVMSELLSRPITRAKVLPMNGHRGVAGGHLSYVETDAGRFVLKRMSAESDWIMFASDDHQCRSVTLWQYGLLDQLRPHSEHKIAACSRDGEGWAILMYDLTGNTYSWDKPFVPELTPAFIDAMARLHATFWDDPRLQDPKLGLCSPTELLNMSALPMAQNYPNHQTSPIPQWVREGWKAMPGILEPRLFEHMHRLIVNPQPLFDALKRYPTTLLHGDYRAENLAYHSGYPVLLDWQEAAYSLMTVDLAWFVKHSYVQNAISREQAINHYRSRLENHLSVCFADTDWQAMLELGFCFDALRSACFSAFFSAHGDNPAHRENDLRLVRQQGQYVVSALQWL